MTENRKIAMTHGGNFHADDVFASALLKIVYPDIEIVRGFQVPADFTGIVFDIGFGKYDHHQANAEVRSNGIPYAAFGLLWREFGEGILAVGCRPEHVEREALRFDEKFVQPLDEDDNTGCGNLLAGAIASFNPSWDSKDTSDACFEKATFFAEQILRNKFDSIMSVSRAMTMVGEALEKSQDRIVVLPLFAPWKMTLVRSRAEFVVYPSPRGGYSAQAVPYDTDGTELKCGFPAEWAGKPEEELKRLTGLKTIHFCHNGRFIISTDTVEDAVAACRMARSKAPNNRRNGR